MHTDVTFLVGGKQLVHAHRIVLASQSEYFDCLLYGPMKEGRASEITLKETPADAFRELLKFMYSGTVSTVNLTVRNHCFLYMCSVKIGSADSKINCFLKFFTFLFSLQTALDLHILADRFGFPFLKDSIEAQLISIISIENVLHFYSHAQVSCATLLQERCETFIDQNAKLVIECQSIPYLPKENFKVLIARDTFVVRELQIFNAVQKWIEYNKVDKVEAADLLECVRLTEIPHSELKARVLPSGLYKREQILEALEEGESLDQDCIATRGKTGE